MCEFSLTTRKEFIYNFIIVKECSMPKPQPRDTPVDNLKQNYEYGKNIEQQYEQLEISQSKFGLQNNPIKTTKPEIRFAPRKVYWWLAILDTVIESNRSGYDIFNQLVTLHQLYDNVELSCNKTKTMLKIAVLVGIKTGVIRSDEISVTENPIGETDSLSEEGTEQIKLADPRENPHIYINEDYAHHYLSFEGWQEILTSKKYVDISGLKYSTWLYKSYPLEYEWSKHFREDNVNCTQVVREAVAQAAIGMGESAGVVDISSEFVRIPLNYVFVLKDCWSDIASEDGVGNKRDIIRTLERYRQKGGGEFYFKIFKFMNIIYPDDETEGGYRLQDPTTNEGPELVNVSIQRCKPALTYEPPESPPASFDPDKYAVDQFIGRVAKSSSTTSGV